jgi:broad specificity phosphatase PhoE
MPHDYHLAVRVVRRGESGMAEFYLVRHGQASFGTDDYDRLSPLGMQQSRWLGEYFAERGIVFDRVITGTMQRHRETADAICEGLGPQPLRDLHPGLDEYDFLALFDALGEGHAESKRQAWADKSSFYPKLKQILQLWAADRLPGALPERWSEFARRVADARDFIAQSGARRVLAVSSGGPIGMLAAQALEAPAAAAIELNMQIKNTAVSHFYFNRQTVRLAGFNYVPHLDRPDRFAAITFG